MDPDTALQEFTEAYRRYSALFDQSERVETEGGLSALGDHHETMGDAAEEALSHAAGLFEWLAKGGYPPNWGSPLPRIEVAVWRHDAGADVEVFIDGVSREAKVTVVDPGSGWTTAELETAAAEAIEGASPAASTLLTDWYASAAQSDDVSDEDGA
jgi:hypothetical protein